MSESKHLDKLIDAGMHLSAQVVTFAIQGHVRDQHAGVFDDCENGTCRSCRRHLLAWELAAGDEGHNWIAEMGRRS